MRRWSALTPGRSIANADRFTSAACCPRPYAAISWLHDTCSRSSSVVTPANEAGGRISTICRNTSDPGARFRPSVWCRRGRTRAMRMTHTGQMLESSPTSSPVELQQLAAGIDACLDCVQTCTSCTDSDLLEDDVGALRDCIALCHTCADICDVTARVLSRLARWDALVVSPLLEACVRACTTCAAECDRHAAHHPHCAICAEACRTCIDTSSALLDACVTSG